uniref:FAST kinase domains 5 n=1 Tax=Sphenodon punctatus TaxID=8508 RepID=A0A8D0HM30_SPHPU
MPKTSRRSLQDNCVFNHARKWESGSLENGHSSVAAEQAQNTNGVTCSQGLSSTESTVLDLEFNKILSTRAGSAPPAKSKPKDGMAQDEDPEFFDAKEDPRTFQKLRPDYKALCYDNSEPLPVLSIEESDLILQEVVVLKGSLEPGTIVEYFCKLSHLPLEHLATLKSSTKFEMLCWYGVENIQLFNISELIDILKAFNRLAIPPTHSMLNVYESEFSRRAWNMNLDQQLLVADLWRYMKRSVPRYIEVVLSYVSLHWKNLTLPQLIQLIYIIGEARRAPLDLMQQLESLVLKNIDFINLEEVGTICLGFFKSKNGLSNRTMRKIADKVCDQMADISNYALVNVLKMFRYTYAYNIKFFNQLGMVIPPRIPAIGIQGVMHIALACSAMHYFDERIMNAVAFAVPSRVAYCRSKDVAKLLWSFGNLNYKPPNAEIFYSSLLKELRKKMHEFEAFPEHLITGLLALAFAGQFPEDLIDLVLSPRYIQLSIARKIDNRTDLFTLDGSMAIECPDYTGNRLAPQVQQEVMGILWNYTRQNVVINPEVMEATALLEDMFGGPQYVKYHSILPHTRTSDLEVRFNANRKPIPFNTEAAAASVSELRETGVNLTDDLMNRLFKGIATKQEFEGMRLAIQVSNRNHYCYQSKQLLGLPSLKRRQLCRLGYVVIELPYWEWFPLLRQSRSEKLSYLHHKIFDTILV